MMGVTSRVACVCLFGAVLAAGGIARAAEHKVSMKDLGFDPSEIEIQVGDTVVWTNDDDFDHTVIAGDESFASGKIGPGDRFSHKFTNAGTFRYHCELHPRMKGEVVVKKKGRGRR